MAERAWEQRGQRVSLELRSVNARFLELKLRQPFGVAVEHRLRKRLEGALGRGRVELSIRVDGAAESSDDPLDSLGVGPEQVASALSALASLSTQASEAGVQLPPPNSLELLRFLQTSGSAGSHRTRDASESPDFLDALVDEGIEKLSTMRRAEGESLAATLAELYDELEAQVATIEKSLEGEGARLLESLEQRARALLERVKGGDLDDARLQQELALLLVRGDVSEEFARIVSHLIQARSVLASVAAVGQGKTLDFLSQELLREVTTIGSKITSHTGSAVVIEAKRTIERIREQVQNVE